MQPRRIALALVGVSGLLSVSAHAETIQVTISNLAFSPAEINAKVGDTIAWVNNDPFVHTATARNGETALHTAAIRGWNELVKVLAGYGAKLDAEAVQAKLTPMDFAMARFQPGLTGVSLRRR